ncbi:hypothetical protein BH11CYA1_BH11CYA1_03440 [soil metagenome]
MFSAQFSLKSPVKSFVCRLALLGVAVSLPLLIAVSQVFAADSKSEESKAVDGKVAESKTNSASALHLVRRTASDAEQMAPEAMLSDLRDTRLSLTQLRQQSVNLFLEVTRPRMTVNDTPLEQSPSVISASMFDANKKYLAPRKEWLVLYINTLEPIVHLLCEDINDVDTNGRKVTKAFEQRINPLWANWRENVLSINKSLDQVQGSLPVGDDDESADTNSTIAKAALDIFQRAEELEKIRYRVVLASIEEYKKEASTAVK